MLWFFKTKVLHFKVENTPTKDTKGKGKFKRILSCLFVDKRKLFVTKLSFEEFHLVFFTAERLWLVLDQENQGIKVFEEISGTFCTL